MRQLLEPIVSKFDELLRLMSVESDTNLQLAYATCISQAMGFARYMSFAHLSLSYVIRRPCVLADRLVALL